MNEENTDNYDIRSIILDAIREKNNLTFLELCYVIYTATGRKKEAAKVRAILQDDELTRELRALEAITEDNENKIYYYEEDDYSPNRLIYRKETEKTIRKIRNDELANLAHILKELNEEEEISL